MVGQKEKISIFIFLLLAFCLLNIHGQVIRKTIVSKEKESYDKKVNIGFKTGFRSTNYIVSEMSVDGVAYDDNLLQKNYRMGYYVALYSRFNFKRKFLQPEVSFNIDRAGMTLNMPELEGTGNKPLVKSTIYSFCFPLLYGYDVIRKGPYSLSLFAGPKLVYLWKSYQDYSNFPYNFIQEKLNPLNASIIAGVSVNISEVFFDFRYEQDLFNISKSMSYKTISSEGSKTGNMVFNRRQSCLSFSFGVLF